MSTWKNTRKGVPVLAVGMGGKCDTNRNVCMSKQLTIFGNASCNANV